MITEEKILKRLEKKITPVEILNEYLLCAIEDYPHLITPVVEAGANINSSKNSKNIYPILAAINSRHKESFSTLLNYDVNVNIEDLNGTSPLMLALVKRNDLVEVLVQKKAHINRADLMGNTPFIYALSYHSNKIDYLLQRGAEFNIVNNLGKTPLMIAMERNHNWVDKLINLGSFIFIDTVDKNNDSPLHYAIVNNQSLDIIKTIISKSKNINAKNKKYETFLITAIHHQRKDLLDYLLHSNSPLNIKDNLQFNYFDKTNMSPLMHIIDSMPEYISYFINHGASLLDKNYLGASALDLIVNKEDEKIWEMIFKTNHKIPQEIFEQLIAKEEKENIRIILENHALKTLNQKEKKEENGYKVKKL